MNARIQWVDQNGRGDVGQTRNIFNMDRFAVGPQRYQAPLRAGTVPSDVVVGVTAYFADKVVPVSIRAPWSKVQAAVRHLNQPSLMVPGEQRFNAILMRAGERFLTQQNVFWSGQTTSSRFNEALAILGVWPSGSIDYLPGRLRVPPRSVYGTPSSARVQWLAGPDGTLGQRPSFETCMAQDPTFGRCFTDAQTEAVLVCAEQGSPAGCVQREVDRIMNTQCYPACEARIRGSELYPWGVYSEETCLRQDEANAALAARGMCPITRDCKMGPATCGALTFLGLERPAICNGRAATVPIQATDPRCQTGGGGGPPPCPATCPPNTACNPGTGTCDPVAPQPTGRRKSGSGAGVLLLGLAALGGIAAAIAGRGGFTG